MAEHSPLVRALGAMLRSGDPEFVGAARRRIRRLTAGCSTEDDRRRAVGVSRSIWHEWRQLGGVESLGNGPGRPRED